MAGRGGIKKSLEIVRTWFKKNRVRRVVRDSRARATSQDSGKLLKQLLASYPAVFTAAYATDLLGITQSTLFGWIASKVIEPAGKLTRNKTRAHRFSFVDLCIVACLCKYIHLNGIQSKDTLRTKSNTARKLMHSSLLGGVDIRIMRLELNQDNETLRLVNRTLEIQRDMLSRNIDLGLFWEAVKDSGLKISPADDHAKNNDATQSQILI